MHSAKDAQLMKEYVKECSSECKELLDKLENARYELDCLYEREYEFYEEYDISDDLELEDILENYDEYDEYDFDVDELSDLVGELEYWENEHEWLCNELKERAIRWQESLQAERSDIMLETPEQVHDMLKDVDIADPKYKVTDEPQWVTGIDFSSVPDYGVEMDYTIDADGKLIPHSFSITRPEV